MKGGVRIISGTLRGRKIPVPQVGVRPTTDRVREAIFSMLQRDIQDAVVLDAFAGSGALGIEAISRGAASVTFCEKSTKTAKALRRTLKELDVSGDVFDSDIMRLLRDVPMEFDIIFADPPYAEELSSGFWAGCARVLQDDGLLVLERGAGGTDAYHDLFDAQKIKSYGQTQISVLRLRAHAHQKSATKKGLMEGS